MVSEHGVTVRDVPFDVQVAVEDGPVNVERVGAVTARTVRGDVVVLDVDRRAELTSDDGHVRDAASANCTPCAAGLHANEILWLAISDPAREVCTECPIGLHAVRAKDSSPDLSPAMTCH